MIDDLKKKYIKIIRKSLQYSSVTGNNIEINTLSVDTDIEETGSIDIETSKYYSYPNGNSVKSFANVKDTGKISTILVMFNRMCNSEKWVKWL